METFKARLDKYWENQEILYNYKAELNITTMVSERNIQIRETV